MGRLITSPVPRFPGTIELCDPLTLAQCYQVEVAFGDPNLEPSDVGKRVWVTPGDADMLKALAACSVAWRIDGQPEHPDPETFVATPRIASHKLIIWAFAELRQIYFGEQQVPNV